MLIKLYFSNKYFNLACSEFIKKNRKFPRITKIKITEWYMRPKKNKRKNKN